MTKKGMLERVKTGEYRVRTRNEYIFEKYDTAKAYEFLRVVNLPYALTNVDSVYVWTRGGYNADRFFGFYPIHIRVTKVDVPRWKGMLAEKGWKSIILLSGSRPRETLFGIFFILYPEEKITRTEKTDLLLQVDPIDETVKFCKENIYTFEPALEMLDEEYHLNIGANYRETKTNIA
jgi:hypothetical protein